MKQNQHNQAVNWDIAEARRLVLKKLENYSVQVYLFGSRAKHTAQRSSDIDIAIWPREPLPVSLLAEIRESLENSNILYKVDLVNLAEVDEAFRQKVISEGEVWKD